MSIVDHSRGGRFHLTTSPERAMTDRSSRVSQYPLIATAVATALYFYFAGEARPQAVLFTVGQTFAAVATFGAVIVYRPRNAAAWLLVGSGLALVAMGTLISLGVPAFGGQLGYPSVADVFYISGYLVIIAGVIRLVGSALSSRPIDAVIDALIVTIALGLISWAFIMEPIVDAGGTSEAALLVSLAYPILDVLMLGLAVGLIFTTGSKLPALWLIGFAIITNTASDVGLAVANASGGYTAGTLIDLGWWLSVGGWAAAATHPSMRRILLAAPSSSSQISRRRVAFLMAAALVPPAVLAYQAFGRTEPVDINVNIITSVAVIVLVVFRLVRLATELHRSLDAHAVVEHDLRLLEVQDRKLAQAIVQTSEAILITGPTGEIEYANPAFERLSGRRRDEFVGGDASAFRSLRSPAAQEAIQRAVSAGASWSGDLVIGRRDGTERVAETSISPVREEDGTMTGLVTVVRDVTDDRALAVERERLVSAVEQTSDSVLMADLAGTIQYVNPAFEQVSGYRRDEVIGQNPRMLKSGRQSAAFYRAMWRRLTLGEIWTGRFFNLRADGTLYQVEATISPIRDAAGATTGYVAVERDVTALQEARSALAIEFRDRAQVAAALSRLRPRGSAEETAAAICDELITLPGVDIAVILNSLDRERVVPLAVSGSGGLPMAPGRLLPAGSARYLYERAEQGPWAEAWRARSDDRAYGQAIAGLGIRAMAYAPIRNGGELLGIVAAGTRDEGYARHLIEHLPAVGEFAATASALLSGQLERGRRDESVRGHVRRALAEGGLRPVFQPIVALGSGVPVGYEALTRFRDGTPPDRMIADAHSVGLGLELELACLAAALTAAETLSPDLWLGLNASPDVIVHSSELRALLAGRARRIVLEVTEHDAIDDYVALRRAVTGYGPTVSLAVDDAGSGFASLRHIVELAPRFLKLDISLVRHVDGDLTRQAMIAGLSHFAARAGCEVIAEGIEEPAELEMLRELDVPFGQGYLLGRPEPLSAASGSARRPRLATTVRQPVGLRRNS